MEYQFTGRLSAVGSGSGGYSDKERNEGRRISLAFTECDVPDRMLDRMMDANKGMPVVTVTIDIPDGIVAGQKGREAMEAIAMMEAALEGVDA